MNTWSKLGTAWNQVTISVTLSMPCMLLQVHWCGCYVNWYLHSPFRPTSIL